MTLVSRITFSTILLVLGLIQAFVLNAQIPQNIKVEGEPADDWVSVLATFIIVVVLLSALLYFRFKRKKKKAVSTVFKYSIIVSVCLLLIDNQYLFAQGQESPLTLREAVYGAYGQLKPKNLPGFQWLPDGASYSYTEGEGDAARIVIVNTNNGARKEVTLTMLNRAVQETGYLAMRFLPPVAWMSNNELVFDYFQKIFVYSLISGQAEFRFNYSSDARNTDFHVSSGNLAFTRGNQLFVQSSDSTIILVKRHSTEYTRSGFAPHRFEFSNFKGTSWSPDGSRLAFFTINDSLIEPYPVIDYSSGEPQLNNVRYPLPGEGRERVTIGVYDLETNNTVYLDTPQPGSVYYSHLSWDPSGESIYINELSADQRRLQLVRYHVLTGKREGELITETDSLYVTPEGSPVFLPDQDEQFIWISSRSGYRQAYLYRTDGKLIRQVTGGESDVDEVIGFDTRVKHMYVSVHEPVVEKNVFKVSLSGKKRVRLTSSKGDYFAKLSADRKKLMVFGSTPDQPGFADLYDESADELNRVYTATNPLSTRITGSAELITVDSPGGYKLYGSLVKPADFDPSKKYPVLVYVYGGPDAQLVNQSWMYNTSLWMHAFASEGFLVFTLDTRGGANRGKAFAGAIYGEPGKPEIEDQLAGIAFLESLGYADTDKMAVYGWSYGGYLAASLMLRAPGVFKVGVAGGTISDWSLYEGVFAERYLQTPDQNPEGYKNSNLATYAANLSGSLLLIRGGADEVVLPVNSEMLVKKLVDSGKKIDYFVYPGHPHQIHGVDRLHLMEKVLDYIKEKIHQP